MNKIKKLLPYNIIQFCVYVFAAFMMKDTGSAMFVLLGILPLSVCIVSYMYGEQQHTDIWLYAICSGLLFMPVIYLFMNESAFVYVIGYGVLSWISGLLGCFATK